ncbi:MAG: ATP-binding cassette domain-containing protein [Candidatus Caldarchaeum sp.]|uniref:ATP-binding cassette domain-containing protein n=1 Tax=Caldiarchaeum subterraneum TaxID=311458 RepID=A0A7C5L7A4_CALS0
MNDVLNVVNLDAFYGKAQILFGLNFSVKKGEIVSLIGRNGVGKTTLLKAIMNISVSKRGKVFLNGHDITSLPTHAIASKGIAYMPDYAGLIPGVSVLDNFRLAFGKKSVDLDFAYQVYPEVKSLLDRRADSLSGGERKIVGLLRTFLMNPSVLLVDEPTEGVSPIIASRIYSIITRMKESGLSVLLVEQGIRYKILSQIAERFLVMVNGKIVLETTSDRLGQEIDQIRKYLAVGGET